jgi:hypothetical protein
MGKICAKRSNMLDYNDKYALLYLTRSPHLMPTWRPDVSEQEKRDTTKPTQSTLDMMAAAQPCPFCGSTTLAYAEWFLPDRGITPVIECEQCFAGAPFDVWQKRDGAATRILTTTEVALIEVALQLQARQDRMTGDATLEADATQLEELTVLLQSAESVTIKPIRNPNARAKT